MENVFDYEDIQLIPANASFLTRFSISPVNEETTPITNVYI
ncbi:hypothetical protein J2S09_002620 [Bacillus fengqiuensis]|nr:hypothetical protein [Bacillus fengqiuensis]